MLSNTQDFGDGFNNEDQFYASKKKVSDLEAALDALKKELEEQSRELAKFYSTSDWAKLSDISRRSDSSKFESSQESQGSLECKSLLELLKQLKGRKSAEFRLKSLNYCAPEDRIYEAKILFSQKDIEYFASKYIELDREVRALREKNRNKQGEQRMTYNYSKTPPDQQNQPDCRILIESCFDLLEKTKWMIEIKDYENYKGKLKQEAVCVSVLGHEKMGKSFVTSKILGHPVPQGRDVKTKGLNILYPHEGLKEDIHCIALDTPGTNVSIRTELMMKRLENYTKEQGLSKEEILRRLYADNLIMESLLHEFIVEHADVLLVVVDKIKRDDQKFINSIREKNKIAKKRILIIHNMNSCILKKDVKRAIKEDILYTYKVDKKIIPFKKNGKTERKMCVYEEKDRRGGHTTHIVMAHEGTQAGNYYNEFALEYLRSVLRVEVKDGGGKQLDLIEAFKKHLNSTFTKHFYTKDDNSNHGELFSVHSDTEAKPSCLFLNNANIYDFKWNTINELGIRKTYVEGKLETVPERIKIVDEGEGLKSVKIELEVCGECNDNKDMKVTVDDTRNNGKALVVNIEGKSRDKSLKSEVANETVIRSTRSFGEFKFETPEIDLEGMVVDISKNGRRYQISSSEVPGLKIITIPLIKNKNDEFI